MSERAADHATPKMQPFRVPKQCDVSQQSLPAHDHIEFLLNQMSCAPTGILEMFEYLSLHPEHRELILNSPRMSAFAKFLRFVEIDSPACP
jgi:hypothetical protein